MIYLASDTRNIPLIRRTCVTAPMMHVGKPTTWELIGSRRMLYRDLGKYNGVPTSDVRPEDRDTLPSPMHRRYLMCRIDPVTHEPQLGRTGKRVL